MNRRSFIQSVIAIPIISVLGLKLKPKIDLNAKVMVFSNPTGSNRNWIKNQFNMHPKQREFFETPLNVKYKLYMGGR